MRPELSAVLANVSVDEVMGHVPPRFTTRLQDAADKGVPAVRELTHEMQRGGHAHACTWTHLTERLLTV